MSKKLRRMAPMLAIASCWAMPAQAGPNDLPGWNMSKGVPQGKPWVLPPGIVLTAEGLDRMDLEHCRNRGQKLRSNPIGTDGQVALCLMFRNTNAPGIGTPGPITVTIEGGSTFIPDNMSTQNGIILQKGTVEVRPGETVFLPMHLICMNPNRRSSVAFESFRLGPIVDHPELRKVIAMFDGKPLPPASMAVAALGAVGAGKKVDRVILDLIRQEWKTLGVNDDPAKYL